MLFSLRPLLLLGVTLNLALGSPVQPLVTKEVVQERQAGTVNCWSFLDFVTPNEAQDLYQSLSAHQDHTLDLGAGDCGGFISNDKITMFRVCNLGSGSLAISYSTIANDAGRVISQCTNSYGVHGGVDAGSYSVTVGKVNGGQSQLIPVPNNKKARDTIQSREDASSFVVANITSSADINGDSRQCFQGQYPTASSDSAQSAWQAFDAKYQADNSLQYYGMPDPGACIIASSRPGAIIRVCNDNTFGLIIPYLNVDLLAQNVLNNCNSGGRVEGQIFDDQNYNVLITGYS